MENDSAAHEHGALGEDTGAGIEADEATHLLALPAPPERAMVMIGRAVLRLRLYCGWTQLDVERSSGVDQTTISRLERGTQRGLSIRRLASVLDSLRLGGVSFEPPQPAVPPTPLELMLYGDAWQRAGEVATRRSRRPSRSRRP